MASRFDPQALLDAVDAQRRERGLTWAELSAELHVSTTTICGWLGRTIQSFMPETWF